MHEDNITIARDETIRLLQYLDQILGEVAETKNLVGPATGKDKGLLDLETVEVMRTTAKREIKKVQDLEAVIAIVGTVKAGKSTLINAIVGTQVVPSRANPMTSYPTKIRHVADLKEPRLTFPLAAKFEQLTKDAKRKLAELATGRPLDEIKAFADLTNKETIRRLLAGEFPNFSSVYEGTDAVLGCLNDINDLIRLTRTSEMGLALPQPDDGIEEGLPLVEVAYHHIDDRLTGSGGHFTILDTPGPNEAGLSGVLRETVDQQLRQASAVILVSDGTQLGTDADAQIREAVSNYLGQFADLVHVFVNKYDRMDPRKWTVDHLREFVGEGLIKGRVPLARIFPTSAERAYFSHTAIRSLDLGHTTAHLLETPWFHLFARDALGAGWETDIATEGWQTKARQNAQIQWRESQFGEPLTQVVQTAASNAALICLKGALGKVMDGAQLADSFLGIRASGATKSAEQLQQQISQINSDIEMVREAKGTVDRRLRPLFETFRYQAREVGSTAEKAVLKDLAENINVFGLETTVRDDRQGRQPDPEEALRKAAAEEQDDQGLIERFTSLLIRVARRPFEYRRPSNDSVIPQAYRNEAEVRFTSYDHASKGRELVDKVENHVRSLLMETESQLNERLSELSRTLEKTATQAAIENLRPIIAKAEERLKESFDLALHLPLPDVGLQSGSTASDWSDIATGESRTYQQRVRKDGTWSWIQRGWSAVFGGDAGYAYVDRTENYTVVRMDRLNYRVASKFGEFRSNIEHEGNKYIEQLNKGKDDYFTRMEDLLSRFRTELNKTQNAKSLEKNAQKKLYDEIGDHRDSVRELLGSTKAAQDALVVPTGHVYTSEATS